MTELGLPERVFKTGCEPDGRKKVNCYFNLHWIETIKKALEDDHMKQLRESQFKIIMQMREHTFSVVFVHYLLTLQLNTNNKFELWWTFSGKPIRYALEDFALVTGLNCKLAGEREWGNCRKEKRKSKQQVRGNGEIWKSLFGKLEKPTPESIVDMLNGKKCKDALQRFRLALLLLVEGILCPTSKVTKIRPAVVEMLGDIEEFMKFPWGRESFLLTVQSVKAKVPYHYAEQESVALQGFAHAMILVTVCSCPAIIGLPYVEDDMEEVEVLVEEVLQSALDMKLLINISTAKNLDQRGQAKVKALLVEDRWLESVRFKETPDPAVDKMLALIAEEYPFELNTWTGGVTADEAKLQKPSPPRDAESSVHADSTDDETLIEEGLGYAKEPVRKRLRANTTVEKLDIPVLLRQMADTTVEKLDIPVLLRQMADRYEEQSSMMFEGYLRSVNESLQKIFGEIKGEIKDLKEEIRNLKVEISQVNHSGTPPLLPAKGAPPLPEKVAPPSLQHVTHPTSHVDLMDDVDDVESKEEHLWHKKESRKKLLVLDLNGLLADIVDSKQVEWTKRCKMPEIRNKTVFQRPFLKDFLQFCFEKFEVGIWSSRNKENVKDICNHLLGNLQKKLLFCWDMSQCTKTGAKCLENSKKEMVFKDLNRIWENRESNLPWKKGDYSESNTVLLDDSPYKAFLNPPHTAIFPDTYYYHNKEDTSLGDGGDLRLYLEKLVEAENVQEFIQNNPFGQEAIKEGSKDWASSVKRVRN